MFIAIWSLFFLLVILLLLPATVFLKTGWHLRRAEILDAFASKSAARYMKTFHASSLTADQASLAESADEWLNILRQYYDKEFSRNLVVIGLALLGLISISLLSMCAVTAASWIHTENYTSGVLPAQAVIAILGGYTWVVYDQIGKSYAHNLNQSDMHYASLRLVIAVPIAYAFGMVFNETLSLPMAFVLGALPTKTITTVSRRLAAKYVQLSTDSLGDGQAQVQTLAVVDMYATERFIAEEITTPAALAYADPVRLTIRSGMSFSYVLAASGEALLRYYFGDDTQAMIECGLPGAYECRTVWEIRDSQKPSEQERYTGIMAALLQKTGMAEQVLKEKMEQVARDPYTEFQRECWAHAMRADA